ncbi:MAG TPA: PaaX family transcriptional regulator C-terminal domain-containing protein [Mycobacteriales bacterium]|nr:PaaX family transcriptional regulator C-terminal domain-containing protein [Mycobacteriales bacterium]
MDARSALFDVYGDHLRTWPGLVRGGTPVAALVRLLAPLGVRSAAVRTAVSRMVRAGWLEGVRLPAGPGYALTDRAQQRLDEAAKRIYRTTEEDWDGTWHLVVVTPPHHRTEREHLHAALRYLGYGLLAPTTWVAARPAPELDDVLADAGAAGQRFLAAAELSARDVVRQAWDLTALAAGYRRFLSDARRALDERPTATAADAFAAQMRLVHSWRQFLKVDPGLPAELLPADWPGTTAAAWFDEQSARLLPAARAFVAACLAGTADHDPAPEGLLPCPRPSETAPSRSMSRTPSRP